MQPTSTTDSPNLSGPTRTEAATAPRELSLIAHLLVGAAFGILVTKAQVISWFRIQEMFRFESFHMYGVIGSAVIVGALSLGVSRWLMRLRTVPSAARSRYLARTSATAFAWPSADCCSASVGG